VGRWEEGDEFELELLGRGVTEMQEASRVSTSLALECAYAYRRAYEGMRVGVLGEMGRQVGRPRDAQRAVVEKTGHLLRHGQLVILLFSGLSDEDHTLDASA
jgi:hypothetical protein